MERRSASKYQPSGEGEGLAGVVAQLEHGWLHNETSVHIIVSLLAKPLATLTDLPPLLARRQAIPSPRCPRLSGASQMHTSRPGGCGSLLQARHDHFHRSVVGLRADHANEGFLWLSAKLCKTRTQRCIYYSTVCHTVESKCPSSRCRRMCMWCQSSPWSSCNSHPPSSTQPATAVRQYHTPSRALV